MSYPFFIWTVQRAGATSLANLLMEMSEHSSAESGPFNWRGDKPRQFSQITRNWVENKNRAILFNKLDEIFAQRYLIKHSYEQHGTDFNAHLLRAAAKAGYRHILLRRRDETARLVSKFAAQESDHWAKEHAGKIHPGLASKQKNLLPLPVAAVVRQYTNTRRLTDQLRKLLDDFGEEVREVWYEDVYVGDQTSRLEKLDEIFKFINFSQETIAAHQKDIKKIVLEDHTKSAEALKSIPNLAEVRSAIEAADLAYLVEIGPAGNPAAGAAGAASPRAKPAGRQGAGRPHQAARVHNDDAVAIHKIGHRSFTGGANVWDKVGNLQFDFLVSRGLMPHHRFVDVACGGLRGGRHFINYLDAGNYCGIDKHIELIIYGVSMELGLAQFREKRPHFVVSDAFEFRTIGEGFNYGLAQSLFSHLVPDDISRCLSRLHDVAADGCKFYATFFEAGDPGQNLTESHSAKGLEYTREQMEAFGVQAGWQAAYIGNWHHPRGQKMIEYTRSPR